MTPQQADTAATCLNAAYEGTLSFPQIVRALMGAGFESYDVDYRTATATYFLSTGEHLTLPLPEHAHVVSPAFHSEAIQGAIREAQAGGSDYTYAGFCAKVMAAGCAGYMVSFLGKRVLYFGRSAECHVEHFPH